MRPHTIESRLKHHVPSRAGLFTHHLTSVAFSLCLAASACGGGSSSSGTGGAGTGTGGRAATGTGGRAATGSGGSSTTTGTGGATVVQDAGATGGGTTPGADAAVASGELGKACASDADCGGGAMTCLLPTDKRIFGQGGPARGYCTLPCATEADVPACEAAGGGCVDLSVNVGDPPQGFCMQSCTFGVAGVASKCRMRPDVACTELSGDADAGVPASSLCIPTCSQDSECPAGRKCDDTFSVCVDTKSPGSPMGAHCDSTATTDTCSGICLPIGNGGTTVIASFCSRRCVIGNLMGCNWIDKTMSLATNGPHGICILSSSDADFGDVGYCVQECASAADCSNKDPGLTCDTMTLPADVNSHGFCSWN